MQPINGEEFFESLRRREDELIKKQWPQSADLPSIHKRRDVSGHRLPDLTSRGVRFLFGREYLIAYAPDEKPLWVVAVMHGQRFPLGYRHVAIN